MKDIYATINGRSLVCALEKDINRKKHFFDEDQERVHEQIILREAFDTASKHDNGRDNYHNEDCNCYGTLELIKLPDALQLAVIGGHIEVVELLLNTIMSKALPVTKFSRVARAIDKLLAWSVVAQDVDTKTARTLYRNSGISRRTKNQ